VSKQGKDSIGHPRGGGDDVINAIAGACLLARKTPSESRQGRRDAEETGVLTKDVELSEAARQGRGDLPRLRLDVEWRKNEAENDREPDQAHAAGSLTALERGSRSRSGQVRTTTGTQVRAVTEKVRG
jgi:hypothetical protein